MPFLLGGLVTAVTTIIVSFFSWIIKRLTIDTFKTILVYGVIVTSWGIYASVVAFAINLVITVSNLIMTFLSLFESFSSSGDNSCLAKNINAGLNASGIFEGFSAGMPLINSALSFFILAIFYILTSRLRKMFENGAIAVIGQLGSK